MRTPQFIIEHVAHWLQYFSLAELFFVLNEDARIHPFDKLRVEKIASAVRHTYFSEQSNNDVKMLIQDLSTAFCQTRPLVKPTPISSISIRCNDHLLIPFRSSCPSCNQNLNAYHCDQRRIRVYCYNGSVVVGKKCVFYLMSYYFLRKKF